MSKKSVIVPFATPQAALAHFARTTPHAVALSFPASGGSATFFEWEQRSSAFARGLDACGVRAGDKVALLAENRLEWPIVQLGCAKAGAVLVPLNTHYRSDDLRYALEQSHTRTVVTSKSFRSNAYLDMLRGLGLPVRIISLDPIADGLTYAQVLAQGAADRALPAVDPAAAAAILYTSGTTGFPKGAVLSHIAMIRNGWASFERLRATAADRYTSIIPLFHCAGCIFGILGSLTHGGRYVGVPAFDAELMCKIIEDERCTLLTGVPTSYLAMLQHPKRKDYDLSSLRAGTCGGADCNVDVMAACAAEFPMPGLAQVYGQTECGTIIALSFPEGDDRLATCGPPIEGLEVRATDAQTRAPRAPGQIGQLEVRGASLMDCYYERSKETAETVDAEGWLQTGDLGYVTAEGRVVVAAGRLRDMLIRGGENIYPVEVENVLARHPAIAEIAVFGVPDDYYGEVPVAAVRLRNEASPTELQAFCGERIARFKVPARFYRTDRFPLTASGKIRKTELREWVAAGKLAQL